MKRKSVKLISLLVLASSMVGCGTNSGSVNPSSTPADTSAATSNNTADEQTTVLPTSVKLVSKKSYLYVNEKVSLSVAFEPSNADDDYSIVSSDPTVISVIGKEITALAATAENETVTITVTTDHGLSSSIDFVVYDVIDRVTTLLTNAHNVALNKAVSGQIHVENTETDQPDESCDYSYNIYKNSSELIENYKSGTSDNVITAFNRAIIGDDYVETKRKKTGSGDFSDVTGYQEHYDIVNEVTDSRYEYTLAEAQERLANVQIESSSSIGVRGMEGFILTQFIENTSNFASTYCKDSLTLEENLGDGEATDLYTVSYDYTVEDKNYRVSEVLTLEIDNDGLLVDMSDEYIRYEGEEDMTEVVHMSTTGTQVNGERTDAPEGSFDFSQYYYTDFTIDFHKSWQDYSKASETDYYVGDTAWLNTYFGYSEYISCAPSTASTRIDPIEIVSVSDPDAVEIVNGNRLTFKKVASNIKVTVASANVSKEITLNCVPPTTTALKIGEWDGFGSYKYFRDVTSSHYLSSSWLTGTDRTVNVAGGAAQETPDITVTSSDTSVATVTLVEGVTNQFVFHPIKAGKTTITIVDKTLGEAKKLTKEVTVYDNTDIGIASLLRESAFVPYNQSLYSDFKFSGTDGTSKGDFSGKFGNYDIWGSWKVVDGVVQQTTYSGAFGEITYGSSVFSLTDISYSNFDKYGPIFYTIKATNSSYGDLGEGDGTSIVLY